MKTKFAFFLVLLLCPLQAKGQTEVDLMSIGRSLPLVTRAELEESLAWHQAVVDSIGVKESEREKALEAMEYIQFRLEEGDYPEACSFRGRLPGRELGTPGSFSYPHLYRECNNPQQQFPTP